MLLSSRRTLVQALVASLLVHAVLLLRVAGESPRPVDAQATTIKVVVRPERRAAAPKPPSAAPAKPLAEAVRPASPVVRPAPVPQVVVPGPSSVGAPAAPAVLPEPRDAGQHAPASPLAASEGGPPAAVARPAREGVSADEVSQYSLSLGKALRRYKRYPALARERAWEGTVELALSFNASLAVPEVVLVRSSGQAILDEKALAMMDQAVRATTLPDGLKGRDFRVAKSIRFSLDDDQ